MARAGTMPFHRVFLCLPGARLVSQEWDISRRGPDISVDTQLTHRLFRRMSSVAQIPTAVLTEFKREQGKQNFVETAAQLAGAPSGS